MNKMIRVMKVYVIAGFILCITLMLAWKLNLPHELSDKIFASFPNVVNTIIGFGLMIWFVILTVLLISMITMTSIRERSLKKLANIKDEDEREIYLMGKASRATYISSLSLMLFFLFFSICGVSINKSINPALNGGKKYSISMKFDYNIMNQVETKNNNNFKAIFDTHELIPSSSTILLILIASQLLVYNFSFRREKIES